MFKFRAALLGALVLVLLLPAAALGRTRAQGHSVIPRARVTTGVPQVGGLYSSAGARVHTCTASVVASRLGNVIVTAAHCVRGTGAGMVFVPGLHGRVAPYGRWMVTGAYLEPAWIFGQDPAADIAFLTVAPRQIRHRRVEVERMTGAYPLGFTAQARERVTVPAYPAGVANNPITCTTSVYLSGGYPAFDCHGYVGGTSGAPWLGWAAHGDAIVGIVGGPNQGGCEEYTSYSSPLNENAHAAYARAVRGQKPDSAPLADPDGC